MCGIAGIALADSAAAPESAQLARLAQALAHRGPDGTAQETQGPVGLVHTRLAVIDLASGQQPIRAGATALIANGEIYNYRELRATLGDVAWSTQSDCEPPLYLWQREGLAFTRHLRGMYALAIYDRAARTLTLARDPFGIKPLYVAMLADGLAFASEPQALISAGLLAPKLRAEARDELLNLQFTTGAETIFAGIRRVLPGETLVCSAGRVIEHHRRSPLPAGGVEATDEDTALARLDRVLADSVAFHQRADVPYGLFLSGGTDSAAVLALMARLNAEPVLAFTAGFAAPFAADEREAAAETARSCNARLEAIEITEAMVWQHLPEIVAAMDDPACDYAIIPTWFLARRAREAVKVVLTGEGGDEILAGYGRYRSAMRPFWLGGRVMRGRSAFERLSVLRARAPGWRDGFAAAEAEAALPGRTRLMAAQAADIAEWLPNDLLLKLDRCLMAHGVEGRVPFVDCKVAEALFLLPDQLKVRARRGKWLLRQWLARHCPAARPFAPKRGFTVPIGAWIAHAGPRLAELVAADPAVAEIAEPAKVRALFRHAEGGHEALGAWSLLFWALWHRRHIHGLLPEGDVFETLAAR